MTISDLQRHNIANIWSMAVVRISQRGMPALLVRLSGRGARPEKVYFVCAVSATIQILYVGVGLWCNVIGTLKSIRVMQCTTV